MRLPILATVACLAFAGSGWASEPGVERWPVKTAPPLAGPVTVIPFDQLVTMPDVPGVTHNDARYQPVRIQGQTVCAQGSGPAITGKSGNCGSAPEGALVQTTGWLHLVAGEGDGDFHMQISASQAQGSPCVIVEVPSADYVTDPVLKAQVASVRAWVVSQIFRGRSPSAGGSVLTHPVKVVVTGALFFDSAHVGSPPRGKRGMKAGSLFEIHPVTAIGFAP